VVTSAAGFSPSLRACPATRLETWLRRMAVYHIRYTWQCTFWLLGHFVFVSHKTLMLRNVSSGTLTGPAISLCFSVPVD
jgi:hypothetical protein